MPTLPPLDLLKLINFASQQFVNIFFNIVNPRLLRL
jgi:hypothetical protein